jgi:amino acid transporter
MIQNSRQDTPIEAKVEESLPRTLGVWGIWLLAVNGLIGAGIFGLPSEAARLTGEYSVLVYLLCALLILPIVLCFAELASYFRGTGGPIRYSREAFGSLIGFQTGWLFYMSRIVAFAANSALLVDNIGYFWRGATTGAARAVLLTLICGGLTFLNVIGSVRAMRSLALLTFIKVGALVVLVVAGIGYLGADALPRFESTVPPANNFGTAALLLVYAFVGFENAVVPAGESRNPSRDMPLALLLALGTVAFLYALIQIIAEASVPGIDTSSSPLLDAAAALIGPAGGVLLMLGVIASVSGNLVVTMFGSSRVTYALSLDGSLPQWFGAVHPRFRTPAHSVVCFGALALLLALFGSFRWLAATVVFSRLIIYVLVCVAVPQLRKRHSTLQGFAVPGGYLTPLLGVAACGWLTWYVGRDSFILTGLSILAGSVLYMGARRRSSKTA